MSCLNSKKKKKKNKKKNISEELLYRLKSTSKGIYGLNGTTHFRGALVQVVLTLKQHFRGASLQVEKHQKEYI